MILADTMSRKELQAQYREREVIGGVFAIRNLVNDKLLVGTTADLPGSKNRFEFSQKTNSCTYLKLQSDWDKYGCEQFAFEVLEELKKGEAQATEEFKADIEVLKDMWIEKLSDGDLY